MKTFSKNKMKLTLDHRGQAVSLQTDGTEFIAKPVPLFVLNLRDKTGKSFRISAADAKKVEFLPEEILFSDFYPEWHSVSDSVSESPDLSVSVSIRILQKDGFSFFLNLKNGTELLPEWADFPRFNLKPLQKEGGKGTLLFPYNEGALVDSIEQKNSSPFPFRDPEYPSLGAYTVFPNMIFAQFACYMQEEKGLYFGLEDELRRPKQIDFTAEGSGITTVFRTFNGADFGSDYDPGYNIVLKDFEGPWQAGALLYRNWFYDHKPENVKKSAENELLPDWYEDSPVVLTYPVRGIHDMDEMTANALFPYKNALPYVREMTEKTGARVMALLMHWEGTAPWAPPYVWPPYGGEACLKEFQDALHREGNLLGVYCSGFGYTLHSNLTDYDHSEKIEKRHLLSCMCKGPDDAVQISRICTGQRSGYDLCAGNEKAKEILDEAYIPLFKSGIDYAQILDQNHGGGQYFCYGRDHGHAPCPGTWMTANMQDLLSGWNKEAGKMLLGCESAAAEPFIGNLLLSDNRFELNWYIGQPVPLYAFLYHEFLRNFMGNQVSCPFDGKYDTFRMRLAYSFAAGDLLTLVLSPNGKLMVNWGTRDFEHSPDLEDTLSFIKSLRDFADTLPKNLLVNAKAAIPRPYSCKTESIPQVYGYEVPVPDVFSTAWETEEGILQLFINHTKKDAQVNCGKESFTVPAGSGVKKLY